MAFRRVHSPEEIVADVRYSAAQASARGDHEAAAMILDSLPKRHRELGDLMALADATRATGDDMAEVGQLIEAALRLAHDKALSRRLGEAYSALRLDLRRLRRKAEREHDSIGQVMDLVADAGLEIATIVDVGVARGTPGLYERYPHARLLLIDPVPENEVFMREIAARHPNASYHMAAAANRAGKLTMSVDPGVSGSRLVEVVGAHGVGRDIEVETVRLDELVRQQDAAGPYVIKADTEGAELFVLEGATGILPQTELLILETRVTRIGEAPELFEILAFLKQHGFVAFDIIDRNYNDAAGYLKQFDLVAVREDGMLRDRKTFGLDDSLRVALIYDDIHRRKSERHKAAARALT